MANLEQLQADFLKVQQLQQKLNNEKIRLEAELNAVSQDYQKQLSELLELTKCSDIGEIENLIQNLDKEIIDLKKQVQEQLNQYLETYNSIGLNENVE